MKSIGFTGSSEPLTAIQLDSLQVVLRTLREDYDTMNNGDCINADANAADIWHSIDGSIMLHPPRLATKRAFIKARITLPPLDYLDRNRQIVDASEILVACPGSMEEVLRSGTWSTVRYARKKGLPIVIVYPDGTMKYE